MRSLWLAKAIDYSISGTAVLVGGSAVNLHTGAYRPTDIDMCAYLDTADRVSLVSMGFQHLQGDHFVYEFPDGERWPIEFPAATVDGETSKIVLDDEESVEVISLESLVIDRLTQATDGTGMTFDEAVRLCFAACDDIDWDVVSAGVSARDGVSVPGLRQTCDRVEERVLALRGSG